MKQGVVVIAHNHTKIDYARLSIISGGLAKKHLGKPVSLITDKSTKEWMIASSVYDDAEAIFDKIILVDRPRIDNFRSLDDGSHTDTVPFINSNRHKICEITPYDKTLLIDSDFLIFSNRLNNYWDVNSSVLYSKSMIDFRLHEIKVLDKWISETGINLNWATSVMFNNSPESKLFFDLVSHIQENYRYYSRLYSFNDLNYRNDFSFSIAGHTMAGFIEPEQYLPDILTVHASDVLEEVKDDGTLIFSINSMLEKDHRYAASSKNQDVHIINKQSIIRNYETLKRLL